jgi:hypothetical protein
MAYSAEIRSYSSTKITHAGCLDYLFEICVSVSVLTYTYFDSPQPVVFVCVSNPRIDQLINYLDNPSN